MPGEYLRGFPDPENSPIEKFLLPSTPHLWEDDLYKDLINNGAPHELALAISRSIAQHEDRKALVEAHEKRTLEWWANIHTHSGGTFGSGEFVPWEYPPLRLALQTDGSANVSYDHGKTWSQTTLDAPGSGAYAVTAWADPWFWFTGISSYNYSLRNENLGNSDLNRSAYDTGTNDFRFWGFMKSRQGYYILAGGHHLAGNESRILIADDPKTPADWTTAFVSSSGGRFGQIAMAPSGLLYTANAVDIMASDDGGLSWDILAPIPPNGGGTRPGMAWFKDTLIYASFNGIFFSTDQGSSWDEPSWNDPDIWGICMRQSPQAVIGQDRNGTIQGLPVSTDGVTWELVDFMENPEPNSGSYIGYWDGETWVAHSTNETDGNHLYYTEDPTGLTGWTKASGYVSPGVSGDSSLV